jgi:glycerophosphoryl diester phosphodiesterase
MERLVMEVLARNGLDKPGANPKTPVIIQSFSAESLKKMKQAMGVTLPLTFLVTDRDRDVWLTQARMAEIRGFATGIGPAKGIVSGKPEIVAWAHEAGLSVTPYTFRAAGQMAGKTVREEMSQFLYTFGVDALFTDNPDQFPRK